MANHPFVSGPQVSVEYFPDPGMNGQIVDIGPRDILSALADTDLDIGLGVVLGANGPNSIKLPGQTSDVANLFMGFTRYNPMIEPRSPHYAATDTVGVLRVGRIWLVCQGDVTDQGPLYVIHAGANAGKIRGDAGSGGNAATQVTRGRVIQGATAGNLCQVALNMP